ncbi:MULTISPECIES: flagellin [Brevibacillus]|uniref:flagellin N-terminal helical domain-containing protein n=1 Tax=Brevibacillus TaxID=55080 RepID=UPI00286FD6A8|nr:MULTISPECIES: flagellin [Brevibacillus]MDR9506583.1 flagellin [Brevibacillus agri]
MRINHNLSAMNTQRQLSNNNVSAGKSMEKLSSGYRINRAADDAAGLSISEKMRAQIKSLNAASRNAQDGVSLVQTMEGALTEVSDMLTRAKEIAVQGANGTYNSADRQALKSEYDALKNAITDIAQKTNFNGIYLLKSGVSNVSTYVHYGEKAGDNLKISGGNMEATGANGLGLSVGFSGSLGVVSGARAALGAVDSAIAKVNKLRSDFGAIQNRLEHTQKNLDTTQENLQAAESRIRDVDMAKEMMEFTKNNILSQAATSMLAQANQQPQGVLSLLR